MNNFFTFLKKNWHFFFWPLLAAVLFAPTFGRYNVLTSPDSAPVYSLHYALERIEALLTTPESVAPHDILRIVLPPLFYHDFSYWLDTMLIALGFYWFMRGRKIPVMPAVITGGLFAFAGYSFTLISAGHRGYFFMGPYVVFTFALLTHAILKNRKLYFALAGCTAAWVIRFGPDLCMFFLPTAAMYSLWLFFTCKSTGGSLKNRALPFATGCVIALLAFMLAGAPSILHTAVNSRADRQKQIDQASSLSNISDNATLAEKTAAEKRAARDKWIFATNWSLPPEESIEFIAPCIHGMASDNLNVPYWGRLGRTDGWEQHHQGFFNFRQHTVYLGSIPVAMLLLSVMFYVSRQRRAEATADTEPYVADIPFWFVIGLVALLLSFGRYAPFYKVFYSLPYASFMRAPVKFFRLVEFAFMALAASGLTIFVSVECRSSIRRITAYASFIGAAACAVYAALINANPGGFAAVMMQFGASNLVPLLANNAVNALWHAIIGFAVVGVLALAFEKKIMTQSGVLVTLLSAVAIDVFMVVKPFMYVTQAKMTHLDYDDNIVTKTITESASTAMSVSSHLSQPWLTRSFAIKGIVSYPDTKLDNNAFLASTKGDVVRMWELCGTDFALIPAQLSRSIDRDRVVHLAWLNFSPTSLGKASSPKSDSVEFLKVKKPKPYAKMYTKWRSVQAENYLVSVADVMGAGHDDIVVVQTELPSPLVDGKPGSLEISKMRFKNGSLSTIIKTMADTAQVLVVNELEPNQFCVFIDGVAAKSFIASYGRLGVFVPAGHHVVSLHRDFSRVYITIYSCVILVLFGIGCIYALRKRHSAIGNE